MAGARVSYPRLAVVAGAWLAAGLTGAALTALSFTVAGRPDGTWTVVSGAWALLALAGMTLAAASTLAIIPATVLTFRKQRRLLNPAVVDESQPERSPAGTHALTIPRPMRGPRRPFFSLSKRACVAWVVLTLLLAASPAALSFSQVAVGIWFVTTLGMAPAVVWFTLLGAGFSFEYVHDTLLPRVPEIVAQVAAAGTALTIVALGAITYLAVNSVPAWALTRVGQAAADAVHRRRAARQLPDMSTHEIRVP